MQGAEGDAQEKSRGGKMKQKEERVRINEREDKKEELRGNGLNHKAKETEEREEDRFQASYLPAVCVWVSDAEDV